MRIAFINYTQRKIGGVESYLQAVMPVLANRHTLGFWAETDTPHHRPTITLPVGTDVWLASNEGLGISLALSALEKWQPDILYVHKVDDVLTEEKLLDIAPAVFFSHDYHATCVSGTKSFSFPSARPCHRLFGPACLACYYPRRCGGLSPITMFRLYLRQAKRLALMRRYRAILVASEYMANEYRRHGVAAEVIVHTHKGVERASARIVKEPPRSVLRLAFLGRVEKLKGIALLLRALPSVAKRLKMSVKFDIAGQGQEEPRLKLLAERVTRSNPSVGIHFHGWLDPTECTSLLKKSHLMVMPSVWPEPFGGVGSLAGEVLVPAVAFDVGGISQWLENGVNGVLAPGDPPTAVGLADAIVSASEPKRYLELCAGAHRLASNASIAEHGAAVEVWLQRALQGDTNPP